MKKWEIVKKYLELKKQDVKFYDTPDNIEKDIWLFYIRLLIDAFIMRVLPKEGYELIFNIPENLTLGVLFKLAKETTSTKISMTLERRIDRLI